jgi:hypothetical protein
MMSSSLVSKIGIAFCAMHPKDCRTVGRCVLSSNLSTSLCRNTPTTSPLVSPNLHPRLPPTFLLRQSRTNTNQTTKMSPRQNNLRHKLTPYSTDSAFSPESAVIAAIADTAYFACLRLPSTHSCSSIKFTLLHKTPQPRQRNIPLHTTCHQPRQPCWPAN